MLVVRRLVWENAHHCDSRTWGGRGPREQPPPAYQAVPQLRELSCCQRPGPGVWALPRVLSVPSDTLANSCPGRGGFK